MHRVSIIPLLLSSLGSEVSLRCDEESFSWQQRNVNTLDNALWKISVFFFYGIIITVLGLLSSLGSEILCFFCFPTPSKPETNPACLHSRCFVPLTPAFYKIL